MIVYKRINEKQKIGNNNITLALEIQKEHEEKSKEIIKRLIFRKSRVKKLPRGRMLQKTVLPRNQKK